MASRFATHTAELPAVLPDDAAERRARLEERARPSTDKPALPPEIEKSLAEVEERTAEAYCDLEETIYQLRKAARR